MEKVILQFQGVRDLGLLMVLIAAVALALVAYGVWQLIQGRRRHGVVCLVATMPAVVVLALSGNLSFGVWMLALGLQIALAVGVFYAAVYAYLGTRRMAILMVMRCVAILALLLALFKPAVSIVPDVEGYRPRLPILLDRSESMATADQSGSADRYVRSLRMLLTQDERIRRALRPAYYHFAREVQAVESAEAMGRLRPRGEGTDSTDIAGALRGCAGYYDRSELAGIVLIGDGLHNAAGSVEDVLAEIGVPVYTIGVGSRTETQTGRRNLQLVSIDAPYDAIKNNVSSIDVRVKATGFANMAAEVRLLADGNVVASFPIMTDKGVATIPCELKWTPGDRPPGADAAERQADVRRLQVLIPTDPAETVAQDNSTELHVLVTEPGIRVLYIEGTIRPEYKFLWRTLNIDPNIKFMALIRVQKNKFSAYGSIDGRTLGDLPRAAEDFAMFDVIILGDLDSTFFSRQQMEGFKKFVADGGGLLMIGGHNSFGPGGYAGTPIADVLPVNVGLRSQPQETTPLVPMLTAAGRQHLIFEGIADYFPGPGDRKPSAELPKLPELLGCVTVPGPKPGASVLAVHPTRKIGAENLVVLAVQPFGAGRAAAFTCDTTWQWYMPMQGMGAESPYKLFWGQMCRWLANVQTKSASGVASLVLRTDRPYARSGSDIKVTARLKDDKGKPTNNATVTCRVEPAGPAAEQARAITLAARRSGGLFDGTYRTDAEGKYVIRATATDAAGATMAADELPLNVIPTSTELDTLARNESLLQQIAGRTDGRYADLSGLPEIIDQIVDRQRALAAPAPKGSTHHLYNLTLLFLLFVVLLTAEWLLRRNWQLH